MNEVREGYKITEFGEIPIDWNVEYLENIAERLSGHTPDKKIAEYWSGNIPWISLKDTKRLDKRYISETTDYTTEEGISNSSAVMLPKGTVVLSRDATVGKVGITAKKMATSQHFINYVCGENLYNFYLYYDFYNRKPLFERIGAGSTIKTIGVPFFKSLSIILPPIKEQRKIADILSVVDDQIENTDILIEKTKELKKGLMKKLLTKGIGHSRFKETEIGSIPEEWEFKSLGEITRYRRGSFPQPYHLPEWYDELNGMPFVQVFDVDSNFRLKEITKRKISKVATEASVFAEKGTVIITLQGTLGRTAITQYDAYIDRTLLLFTEYLMPINKLYFMYAINALFDLEKNKADGGVIKTITKETLTKFKIPLPPLKEQHQIASILSSAYEHVDKYELKKEKLQELKKGLMQKLLTGKIRAKV
ncbi:restriction endonuclease subunit S [Clostridium sp.]|uniref:restriction endonuclease subunit S n=1 Tax=Clostridium sp. TaxID=1506 RepID=UPI002FC903F7